MGNYLNPGNSGFAEVRSGLYIDKSNMIKKINEVIGTTYKLSCISRPRRFGKSFATKMLCAYYDKTCDSSELFADLAIAKDEDYLKHLNKYDVIYLDMTNILSEVGDEKIVPYIRRKVSEELVKAYPDLDADPESFTATLVNTVELTGNKIVAIIDEWDAPIREAYETQREYLGFLRSLFKNSGATDKIFAAAYMTGILPIKKDGSQSAISDFQEYSMIFPSRFAEYVGFTEKEVLEFCDTYDLDFSMMKQWYDGYSLEGVGSIYNPNSVIQAMRNNRFRSYWTETSTAKSLMEYISLDFDGLSKTIAELLGGVEVTLDPIGFANDLVTFRNKDDVLTLLVHLGYLAYNEESETVHIPNEEIRREFAKTVREVKRDETLKRVRESDQLIYDTVHQNAEAVATQIEKIHAEETAALFYNSEQALRGIIKLAYFSYKDHYQRFEELPAGDGYADVVYIPKRNTTLPALVIELKWNKSAEGAIAQIKNKHYPEAIKNLGCDILLVGINYDKDAPAGKRKHECVIEEYVCE